jgi:hypothetical protein
MASAYVISSYLTLSYVDKILYACELTTCLSLGSFGNPSDLQISAV